MATKCDEIITQSRFRSFRKSKIFWLKIIFGRSVYIEKVIISKNAYFYF